MIAIIDYQMGNLNSVQKAFSFLGFDTVITDSQEKISSADGVILPGVGAIGSAMEAIKERNMDRMIRAYIASGRPFLGICLGMQVLFDVSEESDGIHKSVEGLSVIPGRVRRFPAVGNLKIPQIGWNQLSGVSNPLFSEGRFMYFVHSYYCEPERKEDTAALSYYGIPYTAAISRGNILATQFHPEKSGEAGLAVLKKWGETTR